MSHKLRYPKSRKRVHHGRVGRRNEHRSSIIREETNHMVYMVYNYVYTYMCVCVKSIRPLDPLDQAKIRDDSRDSRPFNSGEARHCRGWSWRGSRCFNGCGLAPAQQKVALHAYMFALISRRFLVEILVILKIHSENQGELSIESLNSYDSYARLRSGKAWVQTSLEALHFHFHFFYLKAPGAEICPMPHTIIVSKIFDIPTVHVMHSYHLHLSESLLSYPVLLSLCSTV